MGFVAFIMASSLVQQFANMNLPLANTMPEASPIVVHPVGAGTVDQRLPFALYIAPLVVHTALPLLYSPPITITLPLGRTAEAKYNGLYPEGKLPAAAQVPLT